MVCWNQIVNAVWTVLPFVGLGSIVTILIRILGWLNLFPRFKYVGYEVHQYEHYRILRRTVNFKVKHSLGFWSSKIKASLKISSLPEKWWLSWKDTANPPEIELAPFEEAYVRILSVNEDDSTIAVPLAVQN